MSWYIMLFTITMKLFRFTENSNHMVLDLVNIIKNEVDLDYIINQTLMISHRFKERNGCVGYVIGIFV